MGPHGFSADRGGVVCGNSTVTRMLCPIVPRGVAIRLNAPASSTRGIAIPFVSCMGGITSDRVCPA